jgi:hypothetical protein
MTALRQAMLAKLKERCVSADDTLVFAVPDAVGEVERERLAVMKADQRQRGRYLVGNPPFGFRVDGDGKLVEDPEQLAVVQQMKAMRAEGLSLRAIAAKLAESGTTVSHMAVQRIVNADGSRSGAAASGIGARLRRVWDIPLPRPDDGVSTETQNCVLNGGRPQ